MCEKYSLIDTIQKIIFLYYLNINQNELKMQSLAIYCK